MKRALSFFLVTLLIIFFAAVFLYIQHASAGSCPIRLLSGEACPTADGLALISHYISGISTAIDATPGVLSILLAGLFAAIVAIFSFSSVKRNLQNKQRFQLFSVKIKPTAIRKFIFWLSALREAGIPAIA